LFFPLTRLLHRGRVVRQVTDRAIVMRHVFWPPKPGHRVSILPELATAVAIGGITYWLANGIYYQKQGNEYVVVEKPPAPADSSLKTLDFGGKRYYVRDGHYYTRDIDGNYTEVPRPAGL